MIDYNDPKVCIDVIEENFDTLDDLTKNFVNVYRKIHENLNGVKITKGYAGAIGYITAKLTGLKIERTNKVKDRPVTQKDMALIFDTVENCIGRAFRRINKENLFVERL